MHDEIITEVVFQLIENKGRPERIVASFRQA